MPVARPHCAYDCLRTAAGAPNRAYRYPPSSIIARPVRPPRLTTPTPAATFTMTPPASTPCVDDDALSLQPLAHDDHGNIDSPRAPCVHDDARQPQLHAHGDLTVSSPPR